MGAEGGRGAWHAGEGWGGVSGAGLRPGTGVRCGAKNPDGTGGLRPGGQLAALWGHQGASRETPKRGAKPWQQVVLGQESWAPIGLRCICPYSGPGHSHPDGQGAGTRGGGGSCPGVSQEPGQCPNPWATISPCLSTVSRGFFPCSDGMPVTAGGGETRGLSTAGQRPVFADGWQRARAVM